MKVGAHDLTYCTNIHPGESWAEVQAGLATHTLAVKERVSPDAPFGVGLRLSARAARELLAGEELPRLRAWLQANGLYVFTLNGFPYGPFHGTPVKEAVYRPDWAEPPRVAYTRDLATILGGLLPAGARGTISTVPGCFAARASPDRVDAIAAHLIDVAADLWRRAQSGPRMALCLEPEPCCMLETTAQTTAFFEAHLFARAAQERFAAIAGCSTGEAAAALREHLGVCFDTCHAAVQFEDPVASLDALAAAGVAVGKVQVTAGLHVDNIAIAAAALERFADEVYLHQVVVDSEDGLVRFVDLAPALRAHEHGQLAAGPWRVHFHIPVFMRELGAFTNTQDFVAAALPHALVRHPAAHFELETYTWDVLPPEHRNVPVADAIARELQWAKWRMT